MLDSFVEMSPGGLFLARANKKILCAVTIKFALTVVKSAKEKIKA